MEAEQIFWAREACPPNCRQGHLNGGDYHAVVVVERYTRGGRPACRVVHTTTREDFPGDHGGDCPRCGYAWTKDDTTHQCGLTKADALKQARQTVAEWGAERLRPMIWAAADALDPAHQGEQWPDPIAWDGRPLREQAADVLVLVEARTRDVYGQPQWPWEALAHQLRQALGREEV